ncbi:Wzz/FepE/Etk N-terminal domain-containing protein [Pseudomonas quasicaspiana]|uniref:Wzz/FepE/Etk N-terminal domain-containing protein n=1 Tax=Pseudomonas quasicaspiana TaxID=2829821 RepID=UPI001E54FB22|nr:Wzz/FepE/Etk N-terminal domain-containing protein [Pseudomonas quasicaspiana]MCD5978822.1 LPS O-antigen chain length determinant protein WzzB [Pseudomonas quasicaspiana]
MVGRCNSENGGSNEVDLIVLVKCLWKHKRVILLAVSLGLLAAGGYVAIVPPLYEARLYFAGPTQKDIEELNIGRGNDSGLVEINAAGVYETFLKMVESESVRREFFISEVAPVLSRKQDEHFKALSYEEFRDTVKISAVPGHVQSRYVLTVHARDPDDAAEWAKNYIALVATKTKNEILASALGEAAVKAKNLENQTSRAKERASAERADSITRLQNALVISKLIKLDRPTKLLLESKCPGWYGSSLYMRGSIALEAEIKNLQNRRTDEPFIDDLRAHQSEQKFYQELSISSPAIAVYQMDGVVEQESKPVKPRVELSLFLGALIGLLFGAAVAIFRCASAK